jgi:hypothetical protein
MLRKDAREKSLTCCGWAGQTNAEVVANNDSENVNIQGKLVKLTGWLVVVGAIQAVVLVVQAIAFFRTLRILNHQTRLLQRGTVSAKTAANAAKGSADALINSERAWVIVGVKRYQKSATAFNLSITNHGRTPARII